MQKPNFHKKMEEKYDSAFLAILQNEGKIPCFLDQFFSFLYRRTDFFITMKTQHEKMGFPPGRALKLVIDAFKKFETRAKKDAERKEKLKQEKEAQEKQIEVVDMETVSPVLQEVEVKTEPAVSNAKESKEIQTGATASNTLDSGTTEGKPPVDNVNKTKDSSVNNNEKNTLEIEKNPINSKTYHDSESVQESSKTSSSAMQNTSDKTNAKKDKNATDEDDDPELTKQQKEFQSHPESYNGAIRDNYSWSQSITDVDVRIKVPPYVKRGKDVSVTVGKKHLKASCKTTSGDSDTLCDGELSWDVRQEECMWSLVPGEHVHVNLEKVQERWWEAVFTNEPKISVRKIDPSRPITDLDDEAQAKISEMMYNEHQKRLGKPQSHEEKVHKMLEKAWDAEGSPFRGTPFDPSKVNVSPDGGMGFPPQT